MLKLLPFAAGMAVLLFAPDGPRYAGIGTALAVLGIPFLLGAMRDAAARRATELQEIEEELKTLEKELDAELECERREDGRDAGLR